MKKGTQKTGDDCGKGEGLEEVVSGREDIGKEKKSYGEDVSAKGAK